MGVGQGTDLLVMIRSEIKASRHNSMMRIILAKAGDDT